MDINKICILVIIGTFIIEMGVVIGFKIYHNLNTYKRIVDYFPSSLSTMGVLGTFIGIYMGLQEFDPRDIQTSIPILLDGLKTAFSTSLWGMSLSLIFSFIINILSDVEEKNMPTEIETLSANFSESIDKMSRHIGKCLELFSQDIQKYQNSSIKIVENCNRQISDKMLECESILQNRLTDCNLMLDQKLDEFGKSITTANTEALSDVMDVVCSRFENSMNNVIGQFVKETFSELNENVHQLNKWQNDNMSLMKELIEKCNSVIDNLYNTAPLLSDALETSTTEYVEKFTNNCNDAISKLSGIQETLISTFESKVSDILTDLSEFSKELTQGISSHYQEMEKDLENTVESIENISEYIRAINSSEGELGELVKTLKTIVVSDQSFFNISQTLSSSIDKNADTVSQINEVASNLNNWVRSNNKMQTVLQNLIVKLEELHQLKDYNNSFWNSAKQQFSDGITILKQGNEELSKQIANIDQHFYDRLSATMSNLDECLTKIIDSKNKQ